MYQGKSEVAKPRNKDVVRGPSRRPKGLGRRNPHSGVNTRKKAGKKQYTKTAIAISNGLDKISLFFAGKTSVRKPIVKQNPFKKMMDKLLKKEK